MPKKTSIPPKMTGMDRLLLWLGRNDKHVPACPYCGQTNQDDIIMVGDTRNGNPIYVDFKCSVCGAHNVFSAPKSLKELKLS